MMQTDVLAGHLDVSGFIVPNGRNRVKQITFQGSGGGAGVVEIFDTAVAPITASYGRTGALVTVTKSAHGLATGNRIGIGFSAAGGASGTDGNYTITVVDANSFTITDPNSGTVTPGTACRYVNSGARWLVSFGTAQSVTTPVAVLVPGEGILAAQGIYASITNTSFVTVFYG
jgi:hypothetical protein